MSDVRAVAGGDGSGVDHAGSIVDPLPPQADAAAGGSGGRARPRNVAHGPVSPRDGSGHDLLAIAG